MFYRVTPAHPVIDLPLQACLTSVWIDQVHRHRDIFYHATNDIAKIHICLVEKLSCCGFMDRNVGVFCRVRNKVDRVQISLQFGFTKEPS